MEASSEDKALTRSLWTITPIVLLYMLIFAMLFAGIFDRPRTREGKRTPGADSVGDFREAAFAFNRLGKEPGGEEEHAASAEADAMADELARGDILLGRCRWSLVPSFNPHNGWTHAALYAGGGRLIVASNPRSGVIETDIGAWTYPDMTWVVYMRVKSADDATMGKAVAFARQQRGQAYDINWLSKQNDAEGWYCSELIWAAFLHASEGRIDLSRRPAWFGVSPDDIYMSRHTVVVGGHYEKKPDTIWSLLAKAFALCFLASGGGILAPHPFVRLLRRRGY